jgi:hypothetical protein
MDNADEPHDLAMKAHGHIIVQGCPRFVSNSWDKTFIFNLE